jgi:hypothetical protein
MPKKKRPKIRTSGKYPKRPVTTVRDPVERKAFYHATDEEAPLGPHQIAAGAVQHPDSKLWQVWISTNGFDFTQLAAFKEEVKAINAVELVKKEVAAGNFFDEDLVVAFYQFLAEESDEKPRMLPDDLVRKLGRDILHKVIEVPERDPDIFPPQNPR